MILLVDNYDSFVHNLARYFQCLGQATKVVRNDRADLLQAEAGQFDAIVFSPGPGAPHQAGHALELARRLWLRIPMLGVCLGHQILAEAAGATVARAPTPMHGRTSEMVHEGLGLFAGMPSPLIVARYHSLIVVRNTLPSDIEVTGWTMSGEVMAFEHHSGQVVGWQFHPESILTDFGYPLLSAFLHRIGLATPAIPPTIESERPPTARTLSWPNHPVTF